MPILFEVSILQASFYFHNLFNSMKNRVTGTLPNLSCCYTYGKTPYSCFWSFGKNTFFNDTFLKLATCVKYYCKAWAIINRQPLQSFMNGAFESLRLSSVLNTLWYSKNNLFNMPIFFEAHIENFFLYLYNFNGKWGDWHVTKSELLLCLTIWVDIEFSLSGQFYTTLA